MDSNRAHVDVAVAGFTAVSSSASLQSSLERPRRTDLGLLLDWSFASKLMLFDYPEIQMSKSA